MLNKGRRRLAAEVGEGSFWRAPRLLGVSPYAGCAVGSFRIRSAGHFQNHVAMEVEKSYLRRCRTPPLFF
jgi:hypothetical protein